MPFHWSFPPSHDADALSAAPPQGSSQCWQWLLGIPNIQNSPVSQATMMDNLDRQRDKSQAYNRALTVRFTNKSSSHIDSVLSTNASAYRYRPLRDPRTWMRLLYLQPALWSIACNNGLLHCEVMSFRVSKAPRYAALSYAWGEGIFCRKMSIGGKLLPITQNLAVALEHIREQHKAVVLWVDAVCINQDDTIEKNAQVQMMGKIYMKASVVLVWLGPSDDESDTVFKFSQGSLPRLETIQEAPTAEL